jgi:hypothetical protein
MKVEGPKLGELITGQAFRDAVHVAVCPLEVESQELRPGEHVKLNNGKAVYADPEDPAAVGVVDPFLKERRLLPGQKFWCFVLPNTVTSLRHAWIAPAFATKAPNATNEKAIRKDRYDEVSRRVFGDFLLEQGLDDEAAIQHAWTREKQEAEDWLRYFAEEVDVTYEECLEAGKGQIIDTGMNFEPENTLVGEELDKFWRCVELVLGDKVLPRDERIDQPFQCGC